MSWLLNKMYLETGAKARKWRYPHACKQTYIRLSMDENECETYLLNKNWTIMSCISLTVPKNLLLCVSDMSY